MTLRLSTLLLYRPVDFGQVLGPTVVVRQLQEVVVHILLLLCRFIVLHDSLMTGVLLRNANLQIHRVKLWHVEVVVSI